MTVPLDPALVDSMAALESLAPEWWRLWGRCPCATPFTSPAWLVPWWQAFAPGRLRTVALREDGRLVALALLYGEDGVLGRRLLPLGIGLSDSFDLLVDPAAPAAGAALLAAVLTLPGWDSLHLEELPDGAAALSAACPDGLQDEIAAQSVRPVLDLVTGSEPAGAIPAGQRRKLRMSRHRVDRRGGVVETVRPEESHAFLADLVHLHGARWSERGEAGVLADDRVVAFHREALPRLAEAGLARLFRLVVEGQVAGCYYGLQHRDAAYAYLGGFDPAFSFESPGTVLLGHAIQAAAQEGATRFDFLRGQERYKYAWGAADQPNRLRVIRRVEGPDG